MAADATAQKLRRRTLAWIVGIAMAGLMFDGYDLVVYGTVVSTFLRDPAQIGPVDPALAGALGSYALLGVLVGALIAGSIGDRIGRRRMMIAAYAWFSLGMLFTALAHSAAMFGILRFTTGLGVGALLATTAAMVSEYAPPGRRNLYNAVTYAGVPLGSLAAAGIAILLAEHIGWRGMFAIGALPLITLLPLAILRMPESVMWLVSHGRVEEARAIAARTGVALPDQEPAPRRSETEATGYRGLFGEFLIPAVLIGLVSATGLLLVYSLNTWLPELMMRSGFDARGSLSFLLVLNGGAVLGPMFAARFADRMGPRPVVAASFIVGALAILALTLALPLWLLLCVVALVGVGTSGTQTLIYGLAANYFPTRMRGAGVAWCAGFGRLGGVGGPLIGGFLIGAGLSITKIFMVLGALALLGAVLAICVPRRA
ncbi:MAG: MFS transporter [Novosphingobium sp.]|uniref:MFS transporter n=1 Tax=Novosphingobium sp. TaxID=1874826 RepID=UPI0012BEF8FF|nr:MFS transporter [Novosphingobium sp.]MPS68253.1 MFS transporter [Novosphingobium sp.]